jgi:hypothetical protein
MAVASVSGITILDNAATASSGTLISGGTSPTTPTNSSRRGPITTYSSGWSVVQGHNTYTNGQYAGKRFTFSAVNLTNQIVTFATSIAAAGEASFVVTNSMVSAYDIPVVAIASGAANAVTYAISVGAVANGSFAIVISNLSTGALAEALTINFGILHVAQV